MSSTNLHILFNLFIKLKTAAVNCLVSSTVRLSIQKLFLALDETFKNLHALLSRHDIHREPNLES